MVKYETVMLYVINLLQAIFDATNGVGQDEDFYESVDKINILYEEHKNFVKTCNDESIKMMIYYLRCFANLSLQDNNKEDALIIDELIRYTEKVRKEGKGAMTA